MTHPIRAAGVIPARFGSTRFPGKPLALLDGKPMIVHVCEQATRATQLQHVWVATDDERIAIAVQDAGYDARMTPIGCPTGSDRIVASLRPNDDWDIIVNIQGDEPRINPAVIDQVAIALAEHPASGVSTAAVPITDPEVFNSPHAVKVVLSLNGQALFFSRSPIPSLVRVAPEDIAQPRYIYGYKHLGIYGFRGDVLKAFSGWPSTPLERRESLEQLRLLEHGIQIQVAIVAHDSEGVDTPAELAKLNQSG